MDLPTPPIAQPLSTDPAAMETTSPPPTALRAEIRQSKYAVCVRVHYCGFSVGIVLLRQRLMCNCDEPQNYAFLPSSLKRPLQLH